MLIESLKKVSAVGEKRQTCLATAFPRLPTERTFIKPQLQELLPHDTILSDSSEPTTSFWSAFYTWFPENIQPA
jgi:hypothetical protein